MNLVFELVLQDLLVLDLVHQLSIYRKILINKIN